MKRNLMWMAVSVAFFVAGISVGGLVASRSSHNMYAGLAETESIGNLGIRLHAAALLRLERPEEAREILERLSVTILPYLRQRYPDSSEMPPDTQRYLSILQRYHEHFPLPGFDGENAAWLSGLPLPPLPEDCPAPLIELFDEQ